MLSVTPSQEPDEPGKGPTAGQQDRAVGGPKTAESLPVRAASPAWFWEHVRQQCGPCKR
jgi:hypothetical protein